MVQLVDTLDSGSSAEKHVGSSPIPGNAQAGNALRMRGLEARPP